jgi:LysM repeat protein
VNRLILGIALISSPLLSEDPSSNALLHRVKNCEVEMEMLKNSISTQEQSREALEKEVSQLLKATRESLQETKEGTSFKQNQMDRALDKVVQDCKQLKTHSNELSKTVNELAQACQELKETTSRQGQAIKELEQAMRAITSAMGGKTSSKSSGKTASYTVKSGDSLEKIARAHGMTVTELKELNNLKQSTIRAGQELSVREL